MEDPVHGRTGAALALEMICERTNIAFLDAIQEPAFRVGPEEFEEYSNSELVTFLELDAEVLLGL